MRHTSTRHGWVIAVGTWACATAACARAPDTSTSQDAGDAGNAGAATSAVHTSSATSHDLRAMGAAFVAIKACDQVRGRFRPLRAPDDAVATGTLWIRTCEASADGANVAFVLTGDAWQRARTETSATPRDAYERFRISARLSGRLDFGYDVQRRVATLRYVPAGLPSIGVTAENAPAAVHDFRIDNAVIGAIATAIGAPDRAPALADPAVDALAIGIGLKVSLCTSISELAIGSRPKMEGAGNASAPVLLAARGMALFGPQPADRGLTLQLRADRGAVRGALVCRADADALASAYVAGRAPPVVHELATATVQDHAVLHLGATGCPVVLVARPLRLDAGGTAAFSWYRPIAELVPEVDFEPLRCGSATPEPTMQPAPARGPTPTR